MLYTQDRAKQRQFLANTWRKFLAKKPLNPLETQLAEAIQLHPEYHALIENTDAEYFPEQGAVNPFLHINLHLALREQLCIHQPRGIRDTYQTILKKIKDPHEAEHQMMDCIAEMLFAAQKNNMPMDESSYLQCLQRLCR